MDSSVYSDHDSSESESSTRLWHSQNDWPSSDSPHQTPAKTLQILEDALGDVLESSGSLDYVRSDTVRISVQVPQRTRNAIRAGASGEAPESVSFFLEIPSLLVRLEPVWDSGATKVEQLTNAIRSGFLVADTSPNFHLKPLVQWIGNDLELIGLLRKGSSGDGEPSAEALQEVERRVVRRVSQGSETFTGLFALEEDREQDEVVSDILNAVMGSYRACRGRNVITCAFRVIQHNLERFGDKCYLCGVEHVPRSVELVPMSCCNNLCRFRACDMVHGQLYPFIQQHPKVFELLVDLVKAACCSSRAEQIFLPMPPGTDTKTISGLCGGLPTLGQLTECKCENEVRALLDDKGNGYYKHMWWLVSNIPSHITLADFSEIEGIIAHAGDVTVVNKNSTVFRITSQTTSLHRKHLAARKKHKQSQYKYHGSPFDNWYSILKHGPRVMSETEYQLHGRAKGSGIYVAHAYTVANSFSIRNRVSSKSVVGICDVVDVPSSGIDKNSHCWVVKMPELVALKYLIVV